MNKLSFLHIILSILISGPILGQDKTPDWKKLHYLSEQEMYLPVDNRNFFETDPPVPPVRNVAEFDPMQAVLIRYPFGIPYTLIKEMSEDIEVITIVTGPSQEQTVLTEYNANNVNTSNCSFIYAFSDSYWTRDYGPWYVFDGNNQPGIVNFPYNRPRPNDNDIPIHMANYLDIELYGMNLSHTGGNYMTDGLGKSSSTDLVWDENQSLSEQDIDSLVYYYLGIENYFVRPDPLDDYIKHIDCWGKFLGPGKVLIGQVQETDYRYEDYEAAADFFKNTISGNGKPYEVHRVMTPGGSPTTAYTNSLILNNKVFVPISGSSWDDEAIEAYEEAMPGYEIIGIMYGGWQNTDALHCRTKGVADLGMLYIKHMPILGNVGHQFDYEISADIIAYSGEDVYEDSVFVFYSVNEGEWVFSPMTFEAGTTWNGMINDIEAGDEVKYYLYAADESERQAKHPFIGEPDPHEFKVFPFEADELVVYPDTLLYLNFDDCIDGLPLHIVNMSNDSVEINEITPFSYDEGFYWEVTDMPVVPFKIGSDDTLMLNVTIGIPVNYWGQMLQDTLYVQTAIDEFSTLIMVDSELIQDLNEDKAQIQTDIYPNPFQSQLNFEFYLPKDEYVGINLYDLSGRLLFNEESTMESGLQHFQIKSERLGLKPGTYIYRIAIGQEVKSGKVVFSK